MLENEDLSDAQRAALIAGAPMDARNRSTAAIVHTMFSEQSGNAWVFNFHPFYAWNGCSNQALSMRFPDHFDVIEYFMCPEGLPWQRRRAKLSPVHGLRRSHSHVSMSGTTA